MRVAKGVPNEMPRFDLLEASPRLHSELSST
jgi:hypothetical protein